MIARPAASPPAFAIGWRVDLGAWIAATACAPGAPVPPPPGAAEEIVYGAPSPAAGLTAAIALRIEPGAAAAALGPVVRAFVERAGSDLERALRARVTGRGATLGPDAPPGVRSGRLARGVRAVFDPDGFGVRVGVDAPYAWYVEFGTRRSPARPFIRPVFESLAPRLRADLGAVVRAAILAIDQAE